MKRYKALLLALAIILSLSACGGSKTDASSKAVSVAQRAIDIADRYLDGELKYREASSQINDLDEEMKYASSLPDGTAEEIKRKTADSMIMYDISALGMKITLDGIEKTSESYDKVLETRNEIAERAGLKKR